MGDKASYPFNTEREALAWFGGLFDGEGCLSRRVNKSKEWSSFVLQFRMTDKDSLDTAAEVLERFLKKRKELHGPYPQRPRTPTGKCKDIYCLDITTRNDIYAVVAAIWPYVNARRKEKFVEFFDWYKTTNYVNYKRS